LEWGTGALNIDACRIPGESIPVNVLEQWSGFGQIEKPEYTQAINNKGRWPANLTTDGSACVVEQFPIVTSGKPCGTRKADNNIYGRFETGTDITGYGDSGSAARFFYCAKPTQEERNFGVTGAAKDPASVTDFRPTLKSNPENWKNGTENPNTTTTPRKNNHPTVKAQALMRFLILLITPPGGVVLDSFLGSGSTGVAAVGLGNLFIGIDNDPGYVAISKARILAAQAPLVGLL
jgi:site-specific DNA-methyltransferase (adenine-specific)